MNFDFGAHWRNFRHRFLPNRLWARSLLIMVTPVILLQTIGTIVFYDNHWQSVSRRLALGIAAEIRLTMDAYAEIDDPAEKQELMQRLTQTSRFDLRFLPPVDNPPPTKVKPSLRTAELIPALRLVGYPFQAFPLRGDSSLKLLFYTPYTTLEVVVPYKYFFSSTTYVFAFWILGSSLLLTGIAALFLRNQIRPILRLASAAENFGLGRDVETFKPEGATEVRQAATSFIKMRDRIRRHIEERTRMLAGVSHDLRTPLTRMRLQLSMMGDDENARDLLSDVMEMEHMVNGYLDFARGEGKEQTEETDIPDLIAKTVDSLRKDGVALSFTANAPLTMNVRRNDFKRCLWNLITNAERYGTVVRVELNVKEHFAEISVEDNGPGIPAEKRDDVFKAFFRLDESRNTQTGGVGLGLTITRDIVLAHGGKILMGDSTLGGLKAVLVFPK